jgi:hypothetical protein
MITIGYSTRQSNPELQEYLKKSCGVPKAQVIEKVNNGEKSLNQTYNEILQESENDIVILCHDDLYFETKGWGFKVIEHFQKNDFGILGVAGSTYLPMSGMWWEDKRKMIGIVNHEHEGKKWESKYSEEQGKKIKQTVLVDGLFIAVDKNRIKQNFNEKIQGFHFYDLEFCIGNYEKEVKIGVITNIRITHKSIGMTNEQWEENRKLFAERHKEILPIKLPKNEKLKVLISCLNVKSMDEETTDLINMSQDVISKGHSVTLVSEIDESLTSKLKTMKLKLNSLNEPPGFKMGDGVWFVNTPEGKVVSQPNNIYKISETNFDVIIVKDTLVANHMCNLYPETEKIVLTTYNDTTKLMSHESIIYDINFDKFISEGSFVDKIYEVVNRVDKTPKKQKIKIISGHSEKGGSTTAFINLTNELNKNEYDCTFYGPHSWHLSKCKSGLLNDLKLDPNDIIICHFINLPERPKVKKVIFSLHEKNLFEIADVKPFWDELVFINEEQRQYHNRYNGTYSIIPNLKEHLDLIDKPELELVAGVIGTIDINKQTHISIQRAINDGCEKVFVFGSVSDPKYYEEMVKPLFSDKVVYVGHTDNKQDMYNSIGRVYHSSISEVACLIKDECKTTNTKFFGNDATTPDVSLLTNDEVINEWSNIFKNKRR